MKEGRLGSGVSFLLPKSLFAGQDGVQPKQGGVNSHSEVRSLSGTASGGLRTLLAL